MGKKLLYISGSLGLGHAGRDLQIVKELRRLRPDIEITWLADDPARQMILDAGETVEPEAQEISYGTKRVESSGKDFSADLVNVALKMVTTDAVENRKAYRKLLERKKFDLIVGDETYDICYQELVDPGLLTTPFIMIYDFVGFDSESWSPMQKMVTYLCNRGWYKWMTHEPHIATKSLFIGELEDIPDKKMGMMMPSKRAIGKDLFDFVGYIVRFDPQHWQDSTMAKNTLGYDSSPLIVVTIGGTAAASPLLDLAIKAFPLIRQDLPSAKMLLVCGPHVDPKRFPALEGMTVKGYVPDLYKHLAASDLAIISAGGTTSLELCALNRPFVYFPLEHHSEQMEDVSNSNIRKGATNKMIYSQTTPEMLAKAAVENIGKRVLYRKVPMDGARLAAAAISEELDRKKAS